MRPDSLLELVIFLSFSLSFYKFGASCLSLRAEWTGQCGGGGFHVEPLCNHCTELKEPRGVTLRWVSCECRSVLCRVLVANSAMSV